MEAKALKLPNRRSNFVGLWLVFFLAWSSVAFGFAVGDRVQANGTVNVRSTAAGTPPLGTQASGNQGNIIGGPQTASLTGTSYTWWNVNWDTGVDGWVADIGLTIAATQPAAFTLSAAPQCNGSSPMIVLSGWGSSGFTTFDVYRNGSLLSPANTGPTFSNYGSAVTAGTTYSYYVVAKNASGSTTSNTVTVTAPSTCGGTPPIVNGISPTSFTSQTLPYQANITVSGTNLNNIGRVTYTWQGVTNGGPVNGNLPSGSSTSATLAGTVLTTGDPSGTTTWTVNFYDASGVNLIASKTFTVTYAPQATLALSITTTSLPSAAVGTGYSQGVAVSGGQTPYTWLASSGLPSGLNINSTSGAISGTPNVAGTFNFILTVTDSSSPQKTASITLSIIVDNTVAGTPELSSPSNGATVSGTSVTLRWNQVSGAGAYSVGLRDLSTGFLANIPLVIGTSYPASVVQGHSYAWDVASCTSASGGDNISNCPNRASNWSFTVQAAANALATPTGARPGSTSSPGLMQSGSTVTLSWDAVPGATYYDLRVTDMATGTLVVNTTTYGTSYPAPLTGGRKYGWNVAAYDTTGRRSTYTTLLYFQTPPVATTGPYPVILIHGINSSSATWENFRDKLTRTGARYGGSPRVSSDGTVLAYDIQLIQSTTAGSTPVAIFSNPVAVVQGDFYTLDFSDSNDLTYQQQGWELAKIIDEVKRVNNARKVILVAHSMGGLAARAYLQGFARNRQIGDVTDGSIPYNDHLLPYGLDVEKLITVGTPHQGSPMPFICQGVLYVNVICELLSGETRLLFDGISVAMNLLKSNSRALDQLNSNKRNLPPINYVSIVVNGKRLSVAGSDEDGDGIVSVSSQNLASGVALPTNISHSPLPPISISPWCAGLLHLGHLGVESHTCEPKNSDVQAAILTELASAGTPLGATVLPTANTVGISSTADGALTARTLAVTVQPPADAQGTPIQTFVAAKVQQQLYFLTPTGWQSWTGGSFPAYAAGTFAAETPQAAAAHTIQVLDGSLDLSGVVGAQIYVGYGTSDSEMIANNRYSLVHTIQATPSTTTTITTINGACGSSNGGTFTAAPTANLCSSGSPTTVSGSGPWSWGCNGSNGGATAICSANKNSTQAGVVAEFSTGITAGAYPTGITAGPDGNLWFTEWSTGIGRITPSGVVTEFSVRTNAGQNFHSITAGPDGNLWFTKVANNVFNRIGRITPSGVVTEFSAGISADAYPQDITAGPDGNLWFTEAGGNRIGRITPSGVVTEFSSGISVGAYPYGITAGPDGNLWFTEFYGNRIGRITQAGVITEFSAGITPNAGPLFITTGSDGNLWFTEQFGNRIGRITPSGVVTEFSAGISAGAELGSITAGPDGNLWFTKGGNFPNWGNQIGRITPAGVITEFSDGITVGAGPAGITAGPDGNLWFTEFSGNRIGRITP